MDVTLTEVTSTEASQRATELKTLHQYLRDQLERTIKSYERNTEHRRIDPPEFKVGDEVWLHTENITTKRPMKKLDHRRIGPYPITEKISKLAYRLGLPTGLKGLHNVFHVQLLEPAAPNPFPGRTEEPPPPIELEGELEYEVAEIVDSKIDKRYKADGGLRYVVRWAGYEGTADEITTEPAANLTHVPELLREFHKKYPHKPGPASDIAKLKT